MKILFDTSAFIALNDRKDSLHELARAQFDRLTRTDRCFTTNYVIDETITRLRYAIGHRAAVGFADAVFKGRLFTILYVDVDLEAAAVAVLKRYRDQRLSFTDCSTIAAAEANAVDALFAFADDFRKVGLRTIPERF